MGKRMKKGSYAVGMDTRRHIITTARTMFNRYGYKNVSMRAIAAELGISVGNLTYHFPKKLDLVQGLLQDDLAVTLVSEPVTGLHQLEKIINNMLDSLQRNSFYFLDPEVFVITRSATRDNILRVHSQLDMAIDRLIELGLFQPYFTGITRQRVLKILLWSHVAWMQSHIRMAQFERIDQRAFLDAHWTVLSPWLTDAGREELAGLQTE